MPKANTRLAGHGLRHEGRIWTGFQYASGVVGPAKCECGAQSEDLPNGAQRKAWHKKHKEEIKERG